MCATGYNAPASAPHCWDSKCTWPELGTIIPGVIHKAEHMCFTLPLRQMKR